MEKLDIKILDFLNLICQDKIHNRKYYTFGYQKDYSINENIDYGYIPFIFNEDFIEKIEKEEIIPKTNPRNRTGILREYTEFITVHDTASAAPSANARAHANWLSSMANDINSKTWVSWHYTVDEEEIIKHIPDEEVAYHAGDGTNIKLDYIDTKIKSREDIPQPVVTISSDGYFLINNQKTDILAPLTDKEEIVKNCNLPYQGINVKKGENGNYLLGNTYWNCSYNVLSNRGGNLNSIGIETCVNYGSNYITTMRITAYLVAKLLIKYDLGIDRVKQHNFFSGKDCPKTLRYNKMWEEFLELVRINLIRFKDLKDYKFKFISLTPEYLNDLGTIINYQEGIVVKYKVIVSKDDFIKEYFFESKLESN